MSLTDLLKTATGGSAQTKTTGSSSGGGLSSLISKSAPVSANEAKYNKTVAQVSIDNAKINAPQSFTSNIIPTIKNLPGAFAQVGKEAIFHPIKTGESVVSGALDLGPTAVNSLNNLGKAILGGIFGKDAVKDTGFQLPKPGETAMNYIGNNNDVQNTIRNTSTQVAGYEVGGAVVKPLGLSKPLTTILGNVVGGQTVSDAKTLADRAKQAAMDAAVGVITEGAGRVIAKLRTPNIAKLVEDAKAPEGAVSQIATKGPLEVHRAPSVLQVTDATGRSTMQAIKPEDFETFKSIIDSGDKNIAQKLQTETGKSYHLTATPAERMLRSGIEPITGYADPAAITKIASPEISTNIPAEKPIVQPVEGSGQTKTSGLAQGVEQKAIEANLTKTLGDLPEYKSISMKDQAAKASDLLGRDYELAKRIATGQEAPPADLLPESVYVAVENRALKEGDVATLRDLATGSSLTGEATTMGQRIRTLAERNPDSPVSAIRDVAKAREEGIKGKIKDVTKAKSEVVGQIKDTIKKTAGKQSWSEFVDSITC